MFNSIYSNLYTILILINGTDSKVRFSYSAICLKIKNYFKFHQIRYICTSYNNEAVSPIMQRFHWSAYMAFISIYYFAGLIMSNLCVILSVVQVSLWPDVPPTRLFSAILHAGHSGTMASFV